MILNSYLWQTTSDILKTTSINSYFLINLLNSIQYRNEIDHKIDLRVKRQLRRERKLPPGVFIAHLSTEGQLKKK